jgi:hydrogenase maturation protease
LLDLMAISRLAGHWPEKRALIGVQPAVVGWGESLSTAVAAALPEVSNTALAIFGRFAE